MFYLGRSYDLSAKKSMPELVLYQSRQRGTHGLVVSMTGSGKTGLCFDLIEEAAIDGIARREFGAGISANVDAMARIGYLMLREGRWQGREILTREYVLASTRTPRGHEKLPVLHPETYSQAAPHYALLWWNNNDGILASVPRDAYWSWGLHDSIILVIPSLDIVVARAGKSRKREDGADHYEVLRPFFGPIAESVRTSSPPPAKTASVPKPPCGTKAVPNLFARLAATWTGERPL